MYDISVDKSPISGEPKKMCLVEMIRNELLTMPSFDSTIREQDLVQKFQVSRTSVREALKQLEAENLIERRRNRGTRLRRFTLKEVADTYDVRGVLEGFACRVATQRITADELVRMEKLVDEYRRYETPEADPERRTRADDAFHALIVKIADNAMLGDIMEKFSILSQAFAVYRKQCDVTRQFRSTPFSHRKIFEAIRDGNGALAEKLMRRHCQWAKRQLLEQFTGTSLE